MSSFVQKLKYILWTFDNRESSYLRNKRKFRLADNKRRLHWTEMEEVRLQVFLLCDFFYYLKKKLLAKLFWPKAFYSSNVLSYCLSIVWEGIMEEDECSIKGLKFKL